MATGKVKFFNDVKGYGFLIENETNQEYFVHATGLLDKVKKDQLVQFDIEEGKKGPKCVNVQRIK